MINPPSDGVLRILDSDIRQEIKAILRLVPSTTTSFFYVPKACGLRLPKLEHIVKLGTLKSAKEALATLEKSLNPAASNLISDEEDNN